MKLGPIYNGEYQYTVLITPTLSTAFIDVRDEKLFNEHFKCAVFSFLQNELLIDPSSFINISRDEVCLNKINIDALGSKQDD